MVATNLVSHLSPHDQKLFWQFGLGAKVDVPFQCVHQAYEHHAKAHPHLTAVEEFEVKITYGDLDNKANCIAARLRASGANLGSRICLLVERSVYLPIGALGALKTGAAYIPLDGNVVSDSTLKHALKDAAPTVILTLRKFEHRVKEAGIEIVFLDEALCPSFNPHHCVKPKDFATGKNSVYIIYTSGKSCFRFRFNIRC
jgi:non-ribosomal peptide synthetase component F